MKVKIMVGNDLDKLAEEINYFIKNKNVIDEELEFEENRFFPLIKAMEYQGKAGDEK